MNTVEQAAVVYVPTLVADSPTEQWYGIVNKYGVVRQAYFNGREWRLENGEGAEPVYWLKSVPVADYQRTHPQGEVVQTMKWVKASERLPERNKKVIVRNIDKGYVSREMNMGHFTGWGVGMDAFFQYNNTEWLEESSQPLPAKQALYTYYQIDLEDSPTEWDTTICETLEQVYATLANLDIYMDDDTRDFAATIKGIAMTPAAYDEWRKENLHGNEIQFAASSPVQEVSAEEVLRKHVGEANYIEFGGPGGLWPNVIAAMREYKQSK